MDEAVDPPDATDFGGTGFDPDPGASDQRLREAQGRVKDGLHKGAHEG